MLIKQLIVAGSGALASEITRYAEDRTDGPNVTKFDKLVTDQLLGTSGVRVLIHAGSGRQLEQACYTCREYKIPMIQASTGQAIPETLGFPYIEAPNLALPIILFFKAIGPFWKTFSKSSIGKEMGIAMMESHQANKKSVPGTARKIAEIIDYDMKLIHSERDPERQLALGIPYKHLSRHGYHMIEIRGMGVSVKISTAVLGLKPYAEGALTLCEKILERGLTLAAGMYKAEDFFSP